MAGKVVFNKTKINPEKALIKSHDEPKNKFEVLAQQVIANNPGISEERNTSHKPLDLLILLILNQSTTDLLSDKAFAQLKQDYPTYEMLLAENNLANLQKSIQICGLASMKAKYILNTLAYLKERGWLDINLSFINDLSDLEAIQALTGIKGVGIKSASCLLMFSFKRGTFPIDTHLFRVIKRVGGILPPKATVEAAHKIIGPQISGERSFIVHVGLIDLGRRICLASKAPLCEKCYLLNICDFGQEKMASASKSIKLQTLKEKNKRQTIL
jgi:endonuclease III